MTDKYFKRQNGRLCVRPKRLLFGQPELFGAEQSVARVAEPRDYVGVFVKFFV